MSTVGNTFRTGEPGLAELLNRVHVGDIQLPDFQRGWVWDDDHICSLIASLSLSYPIGSVMLLETGGEGARYKPRAVQGAPVVASKTPTHLILDGQQRVTSLYLALRSGQAVPTRTEKGKDIDRIYYLNIASALHADADREEAVVSLPPTRMRLADFNRTLLLDVSSTEKEYQESLFPLALIFSDTYYDWCRGYRTHYGYDKEKMQLLDKFDEEIVQRFRSYRLPSIELMRDTPKEAVCKVFEKVNTGGVALNVFELMTATFAADEFDLRHDWAERKIKLSKQKVLNDLASSDFLQAVTLLSTYQQHVSAGKSVSCKRRDILKCTLDEYKKHAPHVEKGLLAAARLLNREKVFDAYNLPYSTQLVPLSVICAVLGNRFESDKVKHDLARWYWCGVFGELYGSANETRYAMDIIDIVTWIEGGQEPRTIRDANFSPIRLLTLQTRQSAAYKGMMAQLMQKGSHDFISNDSIELTTFFDLAVDIHHIFPRKYCEEQLIPSIKWNSIVNKTPLTSRTNRILSGYPPSRYLTSIERKYGVSVARLDDILLTHHIDPASLRGDCFQEFFIRRACSLLNMVEKAMGKSVVGRDAEEVKEGFGAMLMP